jgi:hypothetical protein
MKLMGISVSWLNDEHSALYLVFDGTWTWDEYYSATGAAITLMDNAEVTVDIVAHLRTKVLAKGIIAQFRGASAFLKHRRVGRIILIGVDYYIQTIIFIFNQVYPHWENQALVVRSLEEAQALVAQPRHPQDKAG